MTGCYYYYYCNITTWCGKKVTKSSHSAVKCNHIMCVLMCKLWVFEKENITVFDVITFHINGRMITEVYPCCVFFIQYVVLYLHL
jgi:hypothetical protein